MVSEHQIEDAVAVLVREADPEEVILFGSYARGTAGPDSDVDLLVIKTPPVDALAEMARLRKALSALRIPVDVIVTGTDHVRSSWADFPGSYLYDALREGKVLYAVDRAGRDAP
jgi:predicted nucleotidyltransferase